MESKEAKIKVRPVSNYHIRKLARSGNTVYLSVGKMIPPDWAVVKVYVVSLANGVCTLRLEQIK